LSIVGIGLLFGGCPKRQAGLRIVYAPAPAPVASASASQPAEAWVVEEPLPPLQETVEAAPEKGTPPKPQRPQRPASPNEPLDTGEAAPAEPPAAVEIPALEPRQSQGPALRGQILGRQNDLQARIEKLERANKLSATGRKTLEDARTFLAQSGKALEEGDLQRSLNLAWKASLLVAALEQGKQ